MMRVTRRTAMAASAGLLLSGSAKAAKSSEFSVQDIRTISHQSDRYHGWPTLIRRHNGELIVVCSGGRESHVCPFGRVELIRSRDQGETWTYERTILDGPIDDRDAGLVETSRGTLLATTFSSLAYEARLKRARQTAATSQPVMPAQQLARWEAAHRRLEEGTHARALGTWMLRSEDGGVTWSPPYRVPVNSPHGPIGLKDRRLLYAGVALWTDDRTVGVCVSDDDGRTWKMTGRIAARPGDDLRQYHELHAVETQSGRIVVHIRNHNKKNAGETLQTHSDDGGQTWAVPRSIGVWGLPSHLLRLTDGRLLMTYGHRRPPLGNQARLSDDNGQSWSEPMVFYDAAVSGDLGYPSTVEIAPGRLVTVWYELLKGNRFAQLRMASWTIQ